MTAPIVYLLLGFAIVNAWVMWMNVKKADDLDALADEVLRDRARVIRASRLLSARGIDLDEVA